MPSRLGQTLFVALTIIVSGLEVAPPKKDFTTKEQTTELFNSKVVSQQPVQRNLDIPQRYGGEVTSKVLSVVGAKHEGMIVKTTDNDQYLVHKGPGHGTVVTHTDNMNKGWAFGESKDVSDSKVTVGDFVKAGGTTFNTAHGNCQHAVKDMQRLSEPSYRSPFEHAMDDLSGINRVGHIGRNCGDSDGSSSGGGGGGGGDGCNIF